MSEYHGHMPSSVELITDSKELQEELQQSFDDRCTVRINGLEFVCTYHNCDNKFRLQEFSRVMPAKPGPAKKEWTVEGLPPVGVPVEYQLRGASNGEWYPTQINFLSGQHVIYCDNDGDEVRNNPSEVKFRPIRTPEQIAAEARDREIADLYFTINWNEGRETWPIISSGRKADYAKAIDAGYRKFEIVDN